MNFIWITHSYYGFFDSPQPGDYNGNGTCDIAIFRGSDGLEAVRGLTRSYFGGPTDSTVPGYYDGDSTRDIVIFRSSSGLWAIRGVTRLYFGSGSDIPVTR